MENNNGYKVVTQKKKRTTTYKVIMLVVLVAFLTFLITSLVMYQYFSNGKGMSNFSMFATSNENDIANTLEKYKRIINQYYLFTKFEFSQYPSQHINWLKNFGIFITINDKVRDIITIKMLIVKFSNVFFICTTYNYIYSFYYIFILILHNLVSFYIKFI